MNKSVIIRRNCWYSCFHRVLKKKIIALIVSLLDPLAASLGALGPYFGNPLLLQTTTSLGTHRATLIPVVHFDDPPGSRKKNHEVLAVIPRVVSLRVGSIVTFRSSCCKLWKCQTCRLTVASRACVINWTSHGTPNKGSYPSAMRKTSVCLPTIDNETTMFFVYFLKKKNISHSHSREWNG